MKKNVWNAEEEKVSGFQMNKIRHYLKKNIENFLLIIKPKNDY